MGDTTGPWIMLVFHATYHAQSMKNLDFRNQEFSDFVKISTLARKEGHCICNYAPQYHCSQVYVKIQILCGPITMQGMRSSLFGVFVQLILVSGQPIGSIFTCLVPLQLSRWGRWLSQTSIKRHQCTLRNTPEEWRHLLRGGSLKSRNVTPILIFY